MAEMQPLMHVLERFSSRYLVHTLHTVMYIAFVHPGHGTKVSHTKLDYKNSLDKASY